MQIKNSSNKNSKVLFIEARRTILKNKKFDLSVLDKLPGKTLSLAATIQYLDLIPVIKNYLETNTKNPKKVLIKQGSHYKAHVLGCQSQAFDLKADCFLLLADGKFHALNNALQINKELYIYSVISKKLDKITKTDLDKHNQKTRGKISRFLMSDKIGVLVSTKSGQFYKNAQGLKKKIENKYKTKKVYIFEADSINTSEFENFDIPIYINSACYGLALDNSKILNYQDILEIL